LSDDWSELLKKDLSKLAEIAIPHAAKIEELRAGERRSVAILFLDLIGFTAISETLDHEEVFQIVNGIMQVLSRVVEGHGGRVDKFEGDLIMALFGASQATENDCIRSVACSLKMLETIAEINTMLSVRNIKLGARIGINYGWVTVAPDPSGHLTVMGDEVNIASRMESNAEMNSVQVAESVQRECGDHFAWKDLGTLKVKGRTKPVHAFQPTGIGLGIKERWERASCLARSPLVGRESEFAVLETCWKKRISLPPSRNLGTPGQDDGKERNRRGGARHILIDIRADAGIGKSRLVNEFLEKIRSRHPAGSGMAGTKKGFLPLIILKGQTLSFAQPPLTLWISLLYHHFNIRVGDKNAGRKFEAAFKKIYLRRKPTPAIQALKKSLPFLKALMAIPEDDSRLEALDDQTKHKETILALRNLLRALCEGRKPVVILLEDLHWMDTSSREALEFILANCDCSRSLFFICLQRPSSSDSEEIIPSVEESFVTVEKIELAPIDQDSCRSLIHHMLSYEESDIIPSATSVETDIAPVIPKFRDQTGKSINKKVEDILLKYSHGNPFYLEELVLAMVESGKLIEVSFPPGLKLGGSEWRLAGDPESLKIPSTLSNLVQSRIDRLEPPYRQSLQRSSVIGMEVIQSIYHWITRKLAFQEDHELTLGELEIRDFLRRFALEPEITYLFKHIVTNKVAYETLLHHNRRILHRLTAEAFEELFSDDNIDHLSSVLAHHYNIAGVRNKAIEWGSKALVRCRQYYENQEALLWSNRLTGWLNEEPESEDRDRQLLEVWKTELEVLLLVGRNDSRRETIERMLNLCEKRKFEAMHGVVLGEYGILCFHLGQSTEALSFYEQALKILRKANDRFHEGIVLVNLAALHSRMHGNAEEALGYYKQALEIFNETGNRNMAGELLFNIGIIKSRMNLLNEAMDFTQQSLKLYRELGNTNMEGAALSSLAGIINRLGRVDDAMMYYKQALDIHREVGDRRREGPTLANLGSINKQLGRVEETLKYYQQAADIFEEIEDLNEQGRIRFWLGNLYADTGKLNQAREQYHEALDKLRNVKNRDGEGRILSNLGLLLQNQGRMDEAYEHLRMALDIHRTSGNRYFEGFTLCTMGVLRHQEGRLEFAKEQLEQALEIHQEIKHLASEGDTLVCLGNLLIDQELMDDAMIHFQQALEISRKLKDRPGEASVIGSIAYWHLCQSAINNHRVEALKHFEEAIDINREIKNLTSLASNLCGLASALITGSFPPSPKLRDGGREKAGESLNEVGELLTGLDYPIITVLYYSVKGRYLIRTDSDQSPLTKSVEEDGINRQPAMDCYGNALALIEHLHLGRNTFYTRDFEDLRQELMMTGIAEKELPLPKQWVIKDKG